MNDRNTYGYGIGWNVENEYISDSKNIFDAYNVQIKKLNDIKSSHARIENILNQTISEEEIRESYDRFYSDSMRSYEAYRQDVLNEDVRRKEIFKGQLVQNNNEYSANLYYLINIKQETRQKVYQRRRELESLLEENNLQLSAINLETLRTPIQYDSEGRIANSDERIALRKRYDETFLQTQKLRHAIETLDQMSSNLQFTEEERALMLSGLNNPAVKEVYDQLDKSLLEEELTNENEKVKTIGEIENTRKTPTGSDSYVDDGIGETPTDDDSYVDDGIGETPTDDDSYVDDGMGENLADDDSYVDDGIGETPTDDDSYGDDGMGGVPFDDEINPLQDDIDTDLIEYENALEEYENLLTMYEEALEILYNLHQAYENGQIEYSEYEKQADYMVERYNYISDYYQIILQMWLKINEYRSLSNEQLEIRLKELEDEFNREYQFRVHEENGMEGHDDDFIDEYNKKVNEIKKELARRNNEYSNLTDEELNRMLNELEDEFNREYQFRAHEENGMEGHDDSLDELDKKIKKIKEELNRRNKLKEPRKPEQPMMILEDKKTEEDSNLKFYNVEELLYKIRGNYEYKPLDSFVYKHKEIKCFNWNKKKERTFLDKPIKLVKTAISSIILGGAKLFSKVSYLRKDIKERIEFCLDNIENLTDEEIDFLFENLTATKMKELQNILPDVAWQALYRRFVKRSYFKFNMGNTKLKSLYLTIVSLYKEASVIQHRLSDENLSIEERNSLEERLVEISRELCSHIVEYDNVYKETDNMINASGMHGISENYRARRTSSVGGRNAKYFDSATGAATVGIIGSEIREALERGDGFTAAKYFIYDEQIKIEHTESKRTLKNRFGKASTGIFQYSPLVEQADYSDDDYLRDVLQTIVIASSIINVINNMALRDQLLAANQQIQMKNVEIAKLNQDIANLKGMFGEYNSDPNAFLDTYYITLKNSLGGLQGASEYLGMTAQAGSNTNLLQSMGNKYTLFDSQTHQLFANLDSQLETVFNSTSLSQTDKILQMGQIYEQGVNEIARQAIVHSGDINAHIAQYGSSFDFTALSSVISTANSVDPSIITNVFNEYVQAAMYVNNLQALSYINSLNINVDMTAATVTLAGIVGQAALDEYRKSKTEKIDDLEDSKEEMQDAMLSVKIYEHELAKERYRKAKEEWDKKGPFYKLFHKKDKPERIDYDLEELREGRSL